VTASPALSYARPAIRVSRELPVLFIRPSDFSRLVVHLPVTLAPYLWVGQAGRWQPGAITVSDEDGLHQCLFSLIQQDPGCLGPSDD
jgi:hypothetical protein